METVTKLPAGAIPVQAVEDEIPTVDVLPKGAIPVAGPQPSKTPSSDPNSPDFEHDFSPINMITNLPGSFAGVVSDTASAVMDPVGTGKALYNMGFEGIAAALADRYGSWEKFQKTLEEDPFGVALDASFVVSPVAGGAKMAAGAAGKAAAAAGSQAGAQAAGAAGKLASGAAKVGRKLEQADPANIVIGAAKAGGRGARYIWDEAIGASTGAGPEAIKLARKAGREGGEAAAAFDRGLRTSDTSPGADDVIRSAIEGLDEIKIENSKQYQSVMQRHLTNPTVVTGAMVDAIKDRAINGTPTASGVPSGGIRKPAPPGMVADLPAEVQKALDGPIKDAIDAFKASPNQNLSGLDTLRANLDAIAENAKKSGTGGSQVALAANAIKKEIRELGDTVSPGYKSDLAKIGEDIGLVKEIERALSLGTTNSYDVARRKLLQALRKNTSSANFGGRTRLLNIIAERKPNIMFELAGQQLSPGLRSTFLTQSAGIGGAGWLAYGGNPMWLTAIAAVSPKLMGSINKGMGTAERPFRTAVNGIHRMIEKAQVGPPQVAWAVNTLEKGANLAKDNASLLRRGVQEVAVAPGRAEEAMAQPEMAYDEEQRQKMMNYLQERNKKLKLGISNQVLARTVDQLSSLDPVEASKGLRTLTENKRLNKLLEE